MEKNSYWNGCWYYFKLDERTSRFDEMKIDTKKELSNEFGSNIFFDYDLKKGIGLILVVSVRYFSKQKI